MRVGLIARMDQSGLGQGQTLRIARLINPDKVMVIDSTSFNGSKQYPEWYSAYNTTTINGFPDAMQIRHFLSGLDKVITCETFYSNHFTAIARDMNVRTICIANPEFFDWFKPNWGMVPIPDKVIVPSLWMMDEMQKRFYAKYLPTPIFQDEFDSAAETNLSRTSSKRRYLFLNGKTAANDRNGLESLYEALELSRGDFEVVVKAQGDVKKHPDPRLIYDLSNPVNQADLFTNFDAMIMPRRYAGQCLPMTEALMSGLPVVMLDIDPNNKILPAKWLVPAYKKEELMTRIPVDVYSAHPVDLAAMLDNLDVGLKAKAEAIHIGQSYEAENLRPQYEELLS